MIERQLNQLSKKKQKYKEHVPNNVVGLDVACELATLNYKAGEFMPTHISGLRLVMLGLVWA